MSADPNLEAAASFSDAAAAITAYATQDGNDSAYVEMVMHMDELEKFGLITALIHLIINPAHDTQEGPS